MRALTRSHRTQVFDAEFKRCDVCYTQYLSKQISSPSYIPSTSWCSAYTNAACCNANTVAKCEHAACFGPDAT
jgi:hypothetical protein